VQHPLQPFDEANLDPGRIVGDRPFSFDRSALAGAEAARRPRLQVRELLPRPLPGPEPLPTEVSLADLHDFFKHPVRGFFRSRLRISTPYDAEEAEDAIPIQLDGLEQWGVGDRLVHDVLSGADPQAGMLAEQLRGLLPPGELGAGVLGEIVHKVKPLVTHGLGLRQGAARTLDVDVDLGDRRLTGTVGDVFGNNLVTVTYSSLGAKQRLAAWLDALALAAGRPDENWTAHTIGRHRSAGRSAQVSPLTEHDARGWLRDLVDVFERGQCEPLPLPVRTSLAWAEEHRLLVGGGSGDPDAKGRAEWVTPRFNDSGFPREDADGWHARAFGERAPYSLIASPPRDDEAFPHGEGPEPPHRLGRYAWRVWGPVLTSGHELVRGI
jgi:exodeoxyribonuclease V gamma subunit